MSTEQITNPFLQGTKEQLVESLNKNSQVGSPRFEQQKMAIIVSCVRDLEQTITSLEKSINYTAKSNDSLSRKLFYLNTVLTFATCLGVVISYFEYIK